jgi:flagellar hook-associated protein 2
MADNIIGALGAGSGVDTRKLAESLVDAERAPRKALIEAKLERAESRISGYGAVRFALASLKDAFAALNDASDFASITTRNSQPAAVGVIAGAQARPGSYSVSVSSLAGAQRSASAGFVSASAPLNVANAGAAFDLTLSVNGGAAQTIAVTGATVQPATTPAAVTVADVVRAIDDAGLGLDAELVNVGGVTPYRIVVTGATGAAGQFTLGSAAAELDFATQLSAAADASLTVNGMAVSSASNSLVDVVPGVTLELYSPTTVGTPARLDLTRDTSGVRQKIEALVTAFRDFEDTLKVLGDRDSTVEEFGGALAGDQLLSVLRSQLRSMLLDTSSSPGSTITAARDLGLSFDRDGVLQLDGARLATALQSNFEQVVTMFTANSEGQSVFSPAAGGVAGDAVKRLDRMLRSDGLVARNTAGAREDVTRQQAALKLLEDRMSGLLERYTRQFSIMESIVGDATSLRTSLQGSFEGLMAMYTRK